MTVQGTQIAAAVAQTAQTAREVARRKHRQEADTDQDAAAMRDRFESHLLALDEGDEQQASSKLVIDQQVPEHRTVPLPQTPVNRPHESVNSAPSADPESQANPDADADARPLYRHLDVQG